MSRFSHYLVNRSRLRYANIVRTQAGQNVTFRRLLKVWLHIVSQCSINEIALLGTISLLSQLTLILSKISITEFHVGLPIRRALLTSMIPMLARWMSVPMKSVALSLVNVSISIVYYDSNHFSRAFITALASS
jgi:hypothetical protein